MKPASIAAAAVAFALAAATAAPAAAESDLRFDASLGGASVIPWDGSGGIGNGYGLTAAVATGRLRAGLSLAGVLPDSRAQGQFAAFFAEASWFLRDLTDADPWSPYVLAGFGLASQDGADDVSPDGVPPARWVATGPEPLAMIAVGLRYGPPRGLYLAADLRQYNATHGGGVLQVGWRF